MELSGTLLVAIMFSTVVGLSIGGLLVTLAGLIHVGFSFDRSRLFFGWAIYFLLLHLSFFWDTAAITRFDDWQFAGFLFIVAGPMLLLLTTQILIADAGAEGLDETFLQVARKFHISFAVLQGWILVALVVLASDSLLLAVRTCLLICIAIVCALVAGRKVQGWMCAAAWVVTVGSAFLI